MLRAEMTALLERKIDELPIALRTVFVMRELEAMTVEETAVEAVLGRITKDANHNPT